MDYILASKSPRRKELMGIISPIFTIETCDIDESSSYTLSPKKAVKNIAFRKGEQIAKKHPHDLVISADTIVVYQNEIIGKPKDKSDAIKILEKLSGKHHYVYTGYAIFLNHKIVNKIVKTKVFFNKLDKNLINSYVESGSPLDKAGAYGIQDNNEFHLIKKITGNYNNVVGFPVEIIKKDINKLIK